MSLTRRETLALAAAALATPASAASDPSATIRDDLGGRPISPLVYGSNEIGAMDGGALSATLDRAALVAFRRLGGNLLTTYDWATNNSNAGKDWRHLNGPLMPDALGLSAERRDEPFAVIDAMHSASRAMGAASLVTLPLAGYVAADRDGEVTADERAPSRRFKPVVWSGRTPADAPIDPAVCDVPQLLARLVARYGGAGSPEGIFAYSLDNEPDLWSETHPRIVGAKPSIASLIERSVAAAKVIKAIDPQALVFGPASWGASGFATFQGAPDWTAFRDKGSFLAAYLDAFRRASEQEGRRLLDVLDVHWYAYSRRGDLFRSEDPRLAAALLDAPRSLDEEGFREDSWVPDALGVGRADGVTLPLLPSLKRTVDDWFAGTKIAVTEFNYGGAGQLASGLALVDALARFSANGVHAASHWGSLSGYLGAAYRLHRSSGAGGRFEGGALGVESRGGGVVRLYAALKGDGAVSLIVVNPAEQPASLDVGFASGRRRGHAGTLALEGPGDDVREIFDELRLENGGFRLALPARSARRYAFA